MPKSKWYAVAKGRVPGIYTTWDECKAQVAGFSGAIFKSFKTRTCAETFMSSNGNLSESTNNAFASSEKSIRKKRARDTADISTSSQTTKRSHNPFKNDADGLCLTIHFDGGSRGNPGVAGCGAELVVTDNTTNPPTTTKYLIREYCGDRETNNYAEYNGLIAGLKQVMVLLRALEARKSLPSMLKLQVCGDSNLIIQQLKGNWKCKHDSLKPLFRESQGLVADMKKIVTNSVVSFDHVYREQNKVADQLANEAMDQRRSWITTDADMDQIVREGAVKVSKKSGNNDTTRSSCEVIDLLESDGSNL